MQTSQTASAQERIYFSAGHKGKGNKKHFDYLQGTGKPQNYA